MAKAPAKAAITGGVHQARKAPNESRPSWPMSMFWGLPMMVAAEPMLLATARPMRKGMGFMPAPISA